jgi:Holliday junction resolvase - archaeal type
VNGRASKRKGTNGEREVVNIARQHGIHAERAYMSNGKALGQAETVDAIIGNLRTQIKRRKTIANYIKPPQETDITILREDHGQWHAIMPYTLLLKLLKNQK